jgi:hypothetical protein
MNRCWLDPPLGLPNLLLCLNLWCSPSPQAERVVFPDPESITPSLPERVQHFRIALSLRLTNDKITNDVRRKRLMPLIFVFVPQQYQKTKKRGTYNFVCVIDDKISTTKGSKIVSPS